jgi:hypothetical protein
MQAMGMEVEVLGPVTPDQADSDREAYGETLMRVRTLAGEEFAAFETELHPMPTAETPHNAYPQHTPTTPQKAAGFLRLHHNNQPITPAHPPPTQPRSQPIILPNNKRGETPIAARREALRGVCLWPR